MTITNEMIGKKVSLMVTGMRVNGTVVEIYSAKSYTGEMYYGLVVEHQPVQWGKDTFTRSTSLGSNLNTVILKD